MIARIDTSFAAWFYESAGLIHCLSSDMIDTIIVWLFSQICRLISMKAHLFFYKCTNFTSFERGFLLKH